MRLSWAMGLLLSAASVSCAESNGGLKAIVEVPAQNSDAYPYDVIDTLTLSIAHDGADSAIALDTAAVGKSLRLSTVAFGDGLVVHLSGSLGNEELAYGRTCAVDVLNNGDEELTPHLYFSRLVRWGQGPQLVSASEGGLVGLSVAEGRLAMFLGPSQAEVDVVDPTSARGESVVRPLRAKVIARSDATISPLGEGAIVVGGTGITGDSVEMIEVIFPSETTLSAQVRQVPGPALQKHSSVSLEDGSVLVAGGLVLDPVSGAVLHSETAWVFSLLDGEVQQRELVSGLRIPRTRHTMTRLGNEVGADVLIVGGLDASEAVVSQSELYRPLRGAFENTTNGRLLHPRFNHRSVRLPGGFVLVIGGQSIDETGEVVPVEELELYDPVTGEFSEAGTLPATAGVVGMSVTQLPDERILIVGGRDRRGNPVRSVLVARFDPIDGVIDLSPTASLALARSEHAAVRLCDGTILVAGGTNGVNEATERYSPPSAKRR